MKTQTKTLSKEKLKGRFYTPLYIVENILDLANYSGENIRKKHIIDNSCGDGAFLTEIVRRYSDACVRDGLKADDIKSELEVYIHGIEIDEDETVKCIENLSETALLYGIKDIEWDINCGDALITERYNGQMDFVLGNPPYVRVHNFGDSFNDIKSFTFAKNGMTDLFIVFYEIGLKMLNKNGVLGYITPSSFFNSLAGSYMRKFFVENNLIDKIVNMKHYQAFSATTYTAIAILKNNNKSNKMSYFLYDEINRKPTFCESLSSSDYYFSDCFYFGKLFEIEMLKKIFFNCKSSGISVKNGYATLCDSVFINDFTFESDIIIPVVKASKGILKKILYPYNRDAQIISEEEISKDPNIHNYLLKNKERLLNRSVEKKEKSCWYAFGRSQALLDTYKDKLAINNLLRNSNDLKIVEAPSGTGVYSGLYLISSSVGTDEIKRAVLSDEFVSYISMLGKYKSGGYYTFSSKDLKAFLDYKFAYRGDFL